jgi:ribosomal protein S12 methylthiotransferase accessory factor YcaO
VDTATLPEPADSLCAAFRRAGLTLVVKALPNDFGLPAFGVACLEQITAWRVLACAGYAARTTPAEALVSALLELAQTRATDLQGAREDRHDIEKQRLTHWLEGHWLATPGPLAAYSKAIESFRHDLEPTVHGLAQAFERVGLTDIAVAEFPAPAGITAVRVLVPGAETWHCTGGEGVLGPRLGRQVNHA